MFGGILLVALVTAALLHMVGMTELAKRIGKAVLGLAVFAPLLAQLLIGTAQHLDGRMIGLVALVAFIAIFILGWIKFVNHRRKLHHWWGESPTSSKQRVEEDL